MSGAVHQLRSRVQLVGPSSWGPDRRAQFTTPNSQGELAGPVYGRKLARRVSAREGVRVRALDRADNATFPRMRDTEVIRRRLWAQIGLPLATATLLSACGSPDQTPPVKAIDKADTKQGEADKAKAKAKTAGPRTNTNAAAQGYVPPTRYDDIPEGEFDYFGPARDPYGEHSEEDGCPSGDWCGSPEDARKFAIKHVPERLGCPSKIVAKASVTNSLNAKDKRWEGLSFHAMMRGRLVTSVTEEKRKTGKDDDICCYHWFEYCSGRPLLDGDAMIVAALRPGASWSCDPAEVAAPRERPDTAIDPAVRARLGELWVEDAQMEHASIAAFERATLELMAMAAPPALLNEIQLAAGDEVIHAQRCFGLAARFSGHQREPGPLTTLEPRITGLAGGALASEASPEQVRADWVRLALDTFVEGCVGETIATLIARRAMRRCEDPAILATLSMIVDDEGRHAGLAWRTIDWILQACEQSPEGASEQPSKGHRAAVLAALQQQAEAMASDAREACESLPAADPQAEALARFGRCDRRTELLARRDAWSELILPTLAAFVGPDAEQRDPQAWV